MSGVNIPLLRKCIEWAEAEAAKPRELCEWEQGFYMVPKSASDPRVSDGYLWVDNFRKTKAAGCGACYCIAGFVAITVHGESIAYSEMDALAENALGLNMDQSSDLFEGDNTIEDVRRIAEEIAGERL